MPARIGLNRRGNIALNAGVELPLNDRDGRYDWRAYVYFIWDFADGEQATTDDRLSNPIRPPRRYTRS